MNRDPNYWLEFYELLKNSTLQGGVMAMIIAALRVLYDDKETRPLRIFLEALICGALALCVTSIVDYFHLPENAAITLGGAIGFIGVNSLRSTMLSSLNLKNNANKLDKK